MTFLQLINNVLTRLRENTIADYNPDTADPYIRSIAAHVNDAKDRVEDSWQWGALRGTDDIVITPFVSGVETPPIPQIALPNSADNHYIIKRIFSYPVVETSSGSGEYTQDLNKAQQGVEQVTVAAMRERYRTPGKAGTGRPLEFAVTGTYGSESDSNNIVITIWPFPDLTVDGAKKPVWGLGVDRVNHQQALVNTDDRLLVPSLPVYTLATALASRERGEVGGTPTSELFSIADRHLSDAIAQDSALYANELIWYSDTVMSNTNVKFA